MEGFHAETLRPGVIQITDNMGVCMTLLAGSEQALLIDTGYGLSSVREEVDELIGADKPRRLLLTHGHHDHILGADEFGSDGVWMFPEDIPVCSIYSGIEQRRRVLDSARARGIPLGLQWQQHYLSFPMPDTFPPPEETDLGGMEVRILKVPGHTPGSAVVLANGETLITGDDWNWTTWLFFPESLPVREYRENMRKLMALPFRWVICSHQQGVFPREALEAFVNGLTDEALAHAQPCPEGDERGIATRCVEPAPGQRLVFDGAKL